MIVTEDDIYARIGEEGFARLIRAFYAQVPNDDILGAMYPKDDLSGAEERLREFLIGRFGGPPRYIEQRGHPRLRLRHMPFAIDQAAPQTDDTVTLTVTSHDDDGDAVAYAYQWRKNGADLTGAATHRAGSRGDADRVGRGRA